MLGRGNPEFKYWICYVFIVRFVFIPHMSPWFLHLFFKFIFIYLFISWVRQREKRETQYPQQGLNTVTHPLSSTSPGSWACVYLLYAGKSPEVNLEHPHMGLYTASPFTAMPLSSTLFIYEMVIIIPSSLGNYNDYIKWLRGAHRTCSAGYSYFYTYAHYQLLLQ